MDLREKLPFKKCKKCNLYCSKKLQFLKDSFSRSSIYLEIPRAKGHDKYVPNFEVCDTPTAPPTQPQIRIVLVHTETARKRLF